MNTIDNISTQPQLIAAKQLEKSPLNVRRTGTKTGIDELKASIHAHGLMQNLVVTDAGGGTFHVIAGARRLTAIHALQAEGKLPADFAVPCQVVTAENAGEMSLAENIVRLAMHPADQFEAFAALIDKGATAAEVARRFGIEESLVLKRMKLARVAPPLLKEYRNDGMTLECLMAYTLTDDHRKQMKVFKSLTAWQKENHQAIRDALTEQMMDADSKLAKFVSVEAYMAAGGTTRRDLFSEEVYLEKPELLNRLAEEKLACIQKGLQDEGWGWVEINPERDWNAIGRCDRLVPRLVDAPENLVAFKAKLDAELDQMHRDGINETESDTLVAEYDAIEQRLNEVEEQLAAYVGFDAMQMKLAGCYVSIGQDGTPHLDKGLVKPEHRKQLNKLLGSEDGKAVHAKPKNPLSESLRRDLATARLQAAQVEIAKHPAIALDLLAFNAASRLLDNRPALDGPAIQFGTKGRFGNEAEPATSKSDFAMLAKSLPSGWRKPKSEVARFAAFRELPQSDKLKLLAYCVSMTLQPKLGPACVEEETAYDVALDLTGGVMSSYWRPDKETFLSRISREQLLAIARGTLGETWASSRAGDKKASLVEQLDRAFADPAKHGQTAEQVEKLKTWLPAGMALSFHLHSPASAKKKVRKAA